MRRDVFITNDSGGLSVVAADAIDAIIEDQRSDDLQFVTSYKALLLELYGDDSMPVRIVVGEPLTAEEDAQWLACASWRIDTTDGRLLVMGGFDPDVMASWKDETGGESDGTGVGLIDASPGSWRVDVYAHAGSMNGRAILDEAEIRPGAAYRRSHGSRPFPLWLAKMLQFSGADDPGYETTWSDVRASIAAGRVAVDIDGGDAVGFLVHVTPFSGTIGPVPAGGWFDRDVNARIPSPFPLGLKSDVDDPELRSFVDALLGREAPEPVRPPATDVVEIIERSTGDPLRRLKDGPIVVYPTQLFHLYWLAALGADSPPRFELWIETKDWKAPDATPEFAVTEKAGGIIAIGPARQSGGWQLWWTARDVAVLLVDLPQKTTLTFATTPRLDFDAEIKPDVGRTLYEGTVAGDKLHVTEMSPTVDRGTFDAALEFVQDVIRKANASDDDERFVLIDAKAEFRRRFAGLWPMDPV